MQNLMLQLNAVRHRSKQSADTLSQSCHERGRRGSYISISLNPSSIEVIANRRRRYDDPQWRKVLGVTA